MMDKLQDLIGVLLILGFLLLLKRVLDSFFQRPPLFLLYTRGAPREIPKPRAD